MLVTSKPLASPARVPLITTFLVALTVSFVPATVLAAESVNVVVDQAKLMKLPDRVSTIVIGNPLIADVTLQPGGLLIVTGKGYGSTNFVALDRNGNVLMDSLVQVEGPTDKLVTVYRGIQRETYSCTPTCQRRITLGDGPDFFKTAVDQTDSLNTKATVAPEKRLEHDK
jgi:Flp pilus assembly secretin CpaC